VTIPPADELDFGKLLIIDSKFNVTEEEVKRTSGANTVRIIDASTPAEDMLLTALHHGQDLLHDDYDDDFELDVFQIEGNELISLPFFIKDRRAHCVEIRANDCRALLINLHIHENIEIMRHSLVDLYERAKAVEAGMYVTGRSDAAIDDLCDRILTYNPSGVDTILEDCLDKVKLILANKW
jgi:hypothetical protein